MTAWDQHLQATRIDSFETCLFSLTLRRLGGGTASDPGRGGSKVRGILRSFPRTSEAVSQGVGGERQKKKLNNSSTLLAFSCACACACVSVCVLVFVVCRWRMKAVAAEMVKDVTICIHINET